MQIRTTNNFYLKVLAALDKCSLSRDGPVRWWLYTKASQRQQKRAENPSSASWGGKGTWKYGLTNLGDLYIPYFIKGS
jgi:hypothetical protein